jgi:hypothetical protein
MCAAIFFSLIYLCRLNKVNIYQYFNDILPRLDARTEPDLATPLPNKWKVVAKPGA